MPRQAATIRSLPRAFEVVKEMKEMQAGGPPAPDADSKLILSREAGDRSGATALEFMDDLRSRPASRVQPATDGHGACPEAVEGAFGGDVDRSGCTATLRKGSVAAAPPGASAFASAA